MLYVLALALATAVAPAAPPATPTVSTPVRDSLTHYYVRRDVANVRRLHRIARTQEDKLLVAYRLFAMTREQSIIRDIPSDRGVQSPRQLALISALWAFRAGTGPKIHLPTHGRRSERILDRARDLAPNDPYVLLVRGQSLYYKPGIFGGDVEAAKETFEHLKRQMRGRSVPGLHPFEADVWIWMCERKLDEDRARATKRRLLAQSPPPMFRQFLLDPP